MAIELYTAPTEDAVGLAAIKQHLRIDFTDPSFDDMLTAYEAAATRYVQEHTGSQLCTATYKLYCDSFYQAEWQHSLYSGQTDAMGTGVIWLPKPPLASVTSITYYDADNASQTLSASYYVVDAKSMPGRIVLASGYSWPSTYDRPNAVTITYIAGTAASAVADTHKQAIKLLVAHWFKNAEPVSDTMAAKIPFTLESLLLMESTGQFL